MSSQQQSDSFVINAGACAIRSWRLNDRDQLVRIANNWRVSRNLSDQFPYPYTSADAECWLSRATEQKPKVMFAITVADQLAGGIGMVLQSDIHRRSAEIGYWLGEEFWGRGIATAAVLAFTKYAFEAHDLLRIYAGVFFGNPASMRVLEKAGYQREGVLRQSVVKDGQILDEVLFAITRDCLSLPEQVAD